ncbi:MAG: hypothetical protein HRU12_15165 [Phaeodactylibacter sp.]|nr:hypothetical protein [Phaeodactylibacter sp.]
MPKITIADVSGGFNLQRDVNARLQQVEDALNTNVLWRTAVAGESNNMDHDIDMDNNELLNAMTISSTNFVSGGVNITSGAEAAVIAATQQAEAAFAHAQNAAASAVTAQDGLTGIGASQAAAAQSAVDSEVSHQAAVNAYNQSIIQKDLAKDEVAKAAVQVGLAADQVTLANDQVQLAGAQVTLATTQATNASDSASTASSNAVTSSNAVAQVTAAETRINTAIGILDQNSGVIGTGDDDAVSNANLEIRLDELPPSVGGNNNLLMNSDFEVDQRDGEITTLDGTTPTGYIADRWYMSRGGTSGSITPQLRDDSSVVNLLSGRKNCKIIEMDYTSLNATNGYAIISQKIENVKTLLRARSDAPAKNLTVSFLANGAETGQKVLVRLRNIYGTGGSPVTSIEATPVDIDGTWTQYEVQLPLTDLGTKTVTDDSHWQLQFWTYGGTDHFGGSLNANSTAIVQLANIKAEIGDTATPLITLPYRENLAGCKYYYQTSDGEEEGHIYGHSSTRNRYCFIHFPVTMRAAPTVTQTMGTIDEAGVQLGANTDQWADEMYTTGYVSAFNNSASNNVGGSATGAVTWSADSEL